MTPNVLSIAGTDPTAGAGIQADLKTFSALGAYGLTVVTALVAQNTQGVRAVHEVPTDFLAAQLDSVFDDVRVDAVKIGMLGNAEVIETVADALARRRPPYVVLDPVMVAKSGDRLLAAEAVSALRERLLPQSDLITPNLPEAADLLGTSQAETDAQMREQVDELLRLGPRGVLLKGGHLAASDSPDLLAVGGEVHLFGGPRVDTKNTHGTGCTLSSGVAALRPQRSSWATALADAKAYLTGALRAADQLDVGTGRGPVHHFYDLWR